MPKSRPADLVRSGVGLLWMTTGEGGQMHGPMVTETIVAGAGLHR